MSKGLMLYAIFLLFMAMLMTLFVFSQMQQAREARSEAMSKIDTVLDQMKNGSQRESSSE